MLDGTNELLRKLGAGRRGKSRSIDHKPQRKQGSSKRRGRDLLEVAGLVVLHQGERDQGAFLARPG